VSAGIFLIKGFIDCNDFLLIDYWQENFLCFSDAWVCKLRRITFGTADCFRKT